MATIGRWVRSSRSPSACFATRSASSSTASGNTCGISCLWIAIRLKLRGANGIAEDPVHPRGEPRRPADLLGQHQIAGAAPRRGRRWAARAAPSSPPAAANGPALPGGPRRAPARCPSAASSSGARPSPSALLVAREDAVADAERRRARTLALQHPEARRLALAPPSAPAPPRPCRCRRRRRPAAPSPSAPRPACGRRGPGPASISPSSPMSLSSRFSAIFSSPFSPNALAISRLPAGASEALDEIQNLLPRRQSAFGGFLAILNPVIARSTATKQSSGAEVPLWIAALRSQ